MNDDHEKNEWMRNVNLVAAILVTATMGESAYNDPAHALRTWGDMVQRIRRIDYMNPPNL